ncbi:WXG100 family type VII secretion target [Kitasatospora sp. RB6PN24]|uniref:WXG100 family type VII secretion target n=1 Tax=Kitasatospora humi TaxID=2893891 RepID=UPI001E59997B|nr:WXG100 family type VII secretion target [Kitasatospora humi]MCC9306849.1 WXG100 family type VII secretion target [Kitasatospora humi]
MADLDFERRINPWLFDSSGNLTDQAKKQFPDLAAAEGPVTIGTPAQSGGQSLSVNPSVLETASQNASVLRGMVRSECDKPWSNVGTAVGAMQGWDSSAALSTAWTIWEQQSQALAARLDTISQNLHANAQNYSNADSANAAHLQQK